MPIRDGHFEADGAAVNLELGFVPTYFMAINASAATGEIARVEWFGSEMGDSKQFQTKIVADNGSTGNVNLGYASSGGIIQDYGATPTIDTGTENSDSDPVRVYGEKGVTIAASFMDDGDEIYYLAILADRTTDHGDINA